MSWIARLFCCLTVCLTAGLYAGPTRVQLNFYDQTVELDVPEGFRYPHEPRLTEMGLRSLYRELEQRPYQTLLADLQSQAAAWHLNDWLFTRLLRRSLATIYDAPVNAPIVEYSTYFLLAQAGFDVRLTYRDNVLQVNVYTEDVLYEIPFIRDGERRYAAVSSGALRMTNNGQAMYLLDQVPRPRGRAFSFVLNRWPSLGNKVAPRTVAFQYAGRTHEISLRYDAGLVELMKDYPLLDEQWYLDAPLSPALRADLLPALRAMIAGKDTRAAVELLVAFTRSAFVYKDDKSVFGGNKPMVADELFHYPYSDCEDRSALFYALVKALLKLPMIVIAYEDHLSVAVAVPDAEGDAVDFRGRRYIFCDPTGPKESSEIGRIPQGYEGASFDVIGHFPGNG